MFFFFFFFLFLVCNVRTFIGIVNICLQYKNKIKKKKFVFNILFNSLHTISEWN